MKPIGSFHGSVEFPSDSSKKAKIKIAGHDNVPLDVEVQKVAQSQGLFKRVIGLFSKKERAFVPLKVEGNTLLVSVDDLARNLKISKSQILHPKKFETLVEDRLQIKEATQASEKVRTTLVNQSVTTAGGKEALELQASEIDKVVQTVFHAHLALQRSPDKKGSEDVHQVIPITDNHRIYVEDSAQGLRVTSLFGEKVGAGTFGTAVRTLDLLGREGATRNRSIVKLPSQDSDAKKQLRNEAEILQSVNPTGSVRGIQKPLQIGEYKDDPFHLGVQYDGSLKDAIKDPNAFGLTSDTAPLLTLQLMEGLSTLHRAEISHADIKPANTFYDKPKSGIGPRLYLADFGDAHHHEGEYSEERARTTSYTVKRDIKLSKLAKKRGENKLYGEIEEKSDVFAACGSIAELVTHKKAFLTPPGEDEIHTIDPDLVGNLVKGGLSQKSAELIQAGLDPLYENRPTAEQIRDSLNEEIGVPNYETLPNIDDISVAQKLQNEPVGTYFLRSSPNGDLRVSVKIGDDKIQHHQMSFEEGNDAFVIKEKLNQIREESQIPKDRFKPLSSQTIPVTSKPSAKAYSEPLRMSKREVGLLLKGKDPGTTLTYKDVEGTKKAVVSADRTIQYQGAAKGNELRLSLEDLECLSPSKISKVKALIALKKMPKGSYILLEKVNGDLEILVHVGDRKIKSTIFPMPPLASLDELIEENRQGLGLVEEFPPDLP